MFLFILALNAQKTVWGPGSVEPAGSLQLLLGFKSKPSPHRKQDVRKRREEEGMRK